ncbi:type II CRISPR-associated endonuclease Cas1 [Akkermansiaceae bacterium]|nr:type II CRISPR-associated endonuclease Cas1 [Akkermansiaceae bacterium]MDB4722821.1 type II CRISPR-associated endonuclease Cas1 [Akkermansiaceae bacterium]
MSYHIVTIDAPSCSLSCRDGQLVCKTDEGTNSIPIEDVAAIVITSFSASIHSRLLLEAAKHGVGLVICESFKPASLVLPANRSTDTLLTRAQVSLGQARQSRLWVRTINAKCANQLSLATLLAPNHPLLPRLERRAMGKHPHKEAEAAKIYWKIYSQSVAETDDFRRGRKEGGINPLLNYGYAILLSTVLQKLFALGIDPTFGIGHATREHSTPLAYDLMEPFRPCVDWRVAQWIREHSDEEDWVVNQSFRRWITAFPIEQTAYLNLNIELRGVIEGVMRSFRKALTETKTTLYKPWTPQNSKWVGSW